MTLVPWGLVIVSCHEDELLLLFAFWVYKGGMHDGCIIELED